ncbi:MAG: nitronate monooxygenase, partial [Chlorobi bacterium]|nr:nitronate monooxygenase [Chlorobiota bacterium]
GLLGKARAKLRMFEGDIENGELEIGQVSAMINKIKPVKNIIDDIILEYRTAKNQINHTRFDF